MGQAVEGYGITAKRSSKLDGIKSRIPTLVELRAISGGSIQRA